MVKAGLVPHGNKLLRFTIYCGTKKKDSIFRLSKIVRVKPFQLSEIPCWPQAIAEANREPRTCQKADLKWFGGKGGTMPVY